MPFQKGNTLAKKGHVVQAKQKQDLWDYIASGGMRYYNELLDKQYQGEEINKEQKQAMDRTERLFPYVKARKTDITTDGKELTPVLVKFLKDDK